jgi:hypothetical protein
MKLVLRTLFFHFLCICLFAVVYWSVKNEFHYVIHENHKFTIIDFILLSTTVQAGVGFSSITPISSFSKLLMILQQFIMISTNVFLLYIFNL